MGELSCPRCGAEVLSSDKFCPNCGLPLEVAPKPEDTCPNCNAPLRPGQKFCTKCGHSLLPLSEAAPKEEAKAVETAPVAEVGRPAPKAFELPPEFRPIEVSHDKPLFTYLPEEEKPRIKPFNARIWVLAGIVVAALYLLIPLPASIAELGVGFWMYRKGATGKGTIFLIIGVLMLFFYILLVSFSQA